MIESVSRLSISDSGFSCCGAPSSSCTRPRWLSSPSLSPATSCSLSSRTVFLHTWRHGCCPPPVSVSVVIPQQVSDSPHMERVMKASVLKNVTFSIIWLMRRRTFRGRLHESDKTQMLKGQNSSTVTINFDSARGDVGSCC